MNNENQPILNQNQKQPKNFWQKLKLWQKISTIVGCMIILLLIYIVVIPLLFCTNINFNLTKNPEYVSCTQNSDCISKSCGCLNKEGASKFSWLTNLCGIRVKCRAPSACTCENNQCKGSYNYLDVKQECCLECKNRTTELPIDIGPNAECGNFAVSSRCVEYFNNNPKTISECVNEISCGGYEGKKCPEGYFCEEKKDCMDCYGICKPLDNQIDNNEEKIKSVFNAYLSAEEKCNINLANSVITEKSKETMHYTCSNMLAESKCYIYKEVMPTISVKNDTAILYFSPFNHKSNWPFFFAKENGEWKIDFYKMAFGIAMGGSGCDTGWGWRNEEIKNEFCGYFKEGECPEEININQTSENILISTDKPEYTPDEKILITIKNNAKKEIKYSVYKFNCLPDLELLGNQNGEWARLSIFRECATEEKTLLSGQSATIEYIPSSWSDKNLLKPLNFASYKFSFKYTIENDENVFEKYGHFEIYSNEFLIN